MSAPRGAAAEAVEHQAAGAGLVDPPQRPPPRGPPPERVTGGGVIGSQYVGRAVGAPRQVRTARGRARSVRRRRAVRGRVQVDRRRPVGRPGGQRDGGCGTASPRAGRRCGCRGPRRPHRARSSRSAPRSSAVVGEDLDVGGQADRADQAGGAVGRRVDLLGPGRGARCARRSASSRRLGTGHGAGRDEDGGEGASGRRARRGSSGRPRSRCSSPSAAGQVVGVDAAGPAGAPPRAARRGRAARGARPARLARRAPPLVTDQSRTTSAVRRAQGTTAFGR